nr:ABC transporter substrate-binding protein [Solibacillus sp. MA9]
MIIGFIMSYWLYIVGAIAAFYFVKWLLKFKKERQLQKIEQEERRRELEHQSTLEYKMNRLLKLANYNTNNPNVRHAYQTKSVLNLQDYWHQYIDLRAKLSLNDTNTYREESVIDLMCDELLQRLDNAEYETTDVIKKEFIESNLTPLLKDVVEIMDGISPETSININAYQLLKAK